MGFFRFHLPLSQVVNVAVSVSSVKTLEEAKVARGCLYLQVPVHEVSISRVFLWQNLTNQTLQYGTLQFNKFEEIQEKGYQAALEFLEKWDEAGSLPSTFKGGKDSTQSRKSKGKSARRNSI